MDTLKIVGYRTLENCNSLDLDREVERFLAEGWRLYAEPRYTPPSKHAVEAYMQTMVLTESDKRRQDAGDPTAPCPGCGADVPEYASACPECGYEYGDRC